MMNFLANISMDGVYSCGGLDFDIPGTFPYLVHTLILIIKIVVPILLIIFGMLDLGKAVIASKEDEIKKGQSIFIKRLITAVVVFLVIQIVQVLISFISSKDANVMNCFNCFVNGRVDEEKGCKLR